MRLPKRLRSMFLQSAARPFEAIPAPSQKDRPHVSLLQKLSAVNELNTIINDTTPTQNAHSTDFLVSVLDSLQPPPSYMEWVTEKNKELIESIKNDDNLLRKCQKWNAGKCTEDEIISITANIMTLHRRAFHEEGFSFLPVRLAWNTKLPDGAKAIYHHLLLNDPNTDQEKNKIILHSKNKGKNQSLFSLVNQAIHEQTHSFQDQLAHAYKWKRIPRSHPAFKGAQFFYLLQKKIPYIDKDHSSYMAQPVENEAHCQGFGIATITYLEAAPFYIRAPLKMFANAFKTLNKQTPVTDPAPM